MTTDDALTTPGHVSVRVVHAADPAAEGYRLAGQVDGDVATDSATAEQLVRDRVEAGRRAVGGGDDDEGVLARAAEIRAAAALAPPLREDDVEELRHLAADLGRAARIRDATESRVAEVLQAKVAASTGVALHPSAVLAAAEGVLEAEAALAIAERQVLEHGSPPPAPEPVAASDDPVLSRPHDVFDEAHLERRRGRRLAVLLVVLLLAAGGGAFAAGAPAYVLPAAVGAAVLLALVLVLRGRRVAARVSEGDLNLAAVGRFVAETDSGRKLASMDAGVAQGARDAWVERRARLDASRDEAEELLRVARNRWHQLAGADADPHRADDVVRAYDPQLAYDSRVTLASPTVRTVAAFQRRVTARWRVAWARVGRDEPPEPEDLEKVLDELLGDHRRASAELARLEEAEARVAAAAAVRRPLLLVEPRDWVAPGRLAQLLSSVPPEGEVVLIERDPDANRA
jgi:hypothetical protein